MPGLVTETTPTQQEERAVATPRPPARSRARRVRRVWSYRWPLLFISPFFVLFAIFFVYPIGYSLWLSFHEWGLIDAPRYVGLDNYRGLLHDSLFWQSMLNAGLLFFIYVPVMTFLAIVLAALLNSHFVRLQGFWRAVIFLPNIMAGTVAAAFTFQLLLDTNSGYMNHVLGWFGASPVPWLDDVWWARVSVGLLVLWAWLGFNMLIMLAGLQAIPPEVTEAAKVDGAGPAQILFRIIIPLLRPVIVFSVTLSIIGTFSLFTEIFILTEGGPANATETPVVTIWRNTFEYLHVGYAAAMSYVYFGVIVLVTLVQFFVISRRDPTHGRVAR
jgi:lactose/L-arabinose transport system permease protein